MTMFQIKNVFGKVPFENELSKQDQSEYLKLGLGSEVWVSFGHVFYCSEDRFRLKSNCTSTDYDSTNFICTKSSLNIDFKIEIHEVLTRKMILQSQPRVESLVCFIALKNGEIQSYYFDNEKHLWNNYCSFRLAIETASNYSLKSIIIDQSTSFVVWCQNEGPGVFDYSVYYQNVSSTNSALILNDFPVKILSRCPFLKFSCLANIVLCLPRHLNSIDSFLTFSFDDKRFSMFTAEGNAIYKSKKCEENYAEILFNTLGLWKNSEDFQLFQFCHMTGNKLYILSSNFRLININDQGLICDKFTLNINREIKLLGFIVYANIVCVFSSDNKLYLCSIQNGGALLDFVILPRNETVLNMWYCQQSFAIFGFITAQNVYRLFPTKDVLSHLNIDSLNDDDIDSQILFQLNTVFSKTALLTPSVNIREKHLPMPLQSEALLLALIQNRRECSKSGIASYGHSENCWLMAIKAQKLIKTRLNKLLSPLVESFTKLEDCRFKLIEN